MIRKNEFLYLLFLVSIYSVVHCYLIKWIITPEQQHLESQLARKESERVTAALHRELKVLDTMAHDWGVWNDTYTFAQNANEAYITSNLNDYTLIGCEINLLYIYDQKGSLLWSRLIDLDTQEVLTLNELPASDFPPDHPLLHHSSLSSSITGLKKTDSGLLLLAAHPILTNSHNGPIRGTMVFGRLLTDNVKNRLREQTKVSSHIIDRDDIEAIADIPIDFKSIGAERPYVLNYTDDEILIYSQLIDYHGNPQWLLEVKVDRSITFQSRHILRYVLISNGLLGLFTLSFMLIFYRKRLHAETSAFRNLIPRTRFSDTQIPHVDKEWKIFTKNEFSQLSQDLRLMIDRYEKARHRDENVITQQALSLFELNELLVNEVKKRLMIEENLNKNQMDLERQVSIRTWELNAMNIALHEEIDERKIDQEELRAQRKRLQNLSSELMEMEDNERRQLAVILHDKIGQSLSVVKMYLDAMIDYMPDTASRINMQQVVSIVDQTIDDTRSLTFDLSPPILYELGLEAALEWLAEELQESYPIEIRTQCAVKRKHASSAFLALLFRTIRELLMNVIQHASAESAEVQVRCKGKMLHIIVSDNGCGITRDKENTTGFGLFSIRERITNIGGTVIIDSKLDVGTKVYFTIPIEQNMPETKQVLCHDS